MGFRIIEENEDPTQGKSLFIGVKIAKVVFL